MIRTLLVVLVLVSSVAHAVELDQKIECKNSKTGQILRSPEKGKGSPYFYSNKMMLELIENGKVEEKFVLQQNTIDTDTGVAFGSGVVFPQGAYFDFNINFASKVGALEFRSVKRERTKFAFDQCSY